MKHHAYTKYLPFQRVRERQDPPCELCEVLIFSQDPCNGLSKVPTLPKVMYMCTGVYSVHACVCVCMFAYKTVHIISRLPVGVLHDKVKLLSLNIFLILSWLLMCIDLSPELS